MILRLAAAASLALGATILMLYLAVVGKAPWSGLAERHLREMKDRTAAPASYTPVSFGYMAALPRRAPVGEYSAYERRAVTLEGYVQRMLRAPDDDLHLDFADSLDAERVLIPYLSAEITPQWHRDSERWRYERLVALFRPYIGGPTRWDAPPRRVRLSGWLMYDYPFEGAAPVYGFPPHVTQWEIHPVTRIEAWDDSLGRFVEAPR